MDRNALAELLQALESRRDAEERRREERYTALIERRCEEGMGNFKGHALPGSFFLIVGLWWSVKFSLWHASRRNKNACHLASKITYRRLEVIEASVILLFALVGMLAEQFVPDGPQLKLYNYEDKHWDHLMNWQHATMYLFFGISAAVSITVHTTGVVPIAFDRLLLAIAVFVEGTVQE
ncbi:UNVERIFIED_CONTAM: hypothetical protein FKN15_027576 [Acipenser sinensis]